MITPKHWLIEKKCSINICKILSFLHRRMLCLVESGLVVQKKKDFTSMYFSSAELKAQVSFSDRYLSVVCHCHCHKLFTYSSSLRRANFNQTWHKAFLGEGNSSSSNEGPRPFPRGDNKKNSENTVTKFLKSFHWAIFNQTWCNASLSEVVSIFLQIRNIKFSKRR